MARADCMDHRPGIRRTNDAAAQRGGVPQQTPARIAEVIAHLSVASPWTVKGEPKGVKQLPSVRYLRAVLYTKGVAHDTLHTACGEALAKRHHLLLTLEHVIKQVGFRAIALIVTGRRRVTIGIVTVEQAIEIIVCSIRTLTRIIRLTRLLPARPDGNTQEHHQDESSPPNCEARMQIDRAQSIA